MRTSRNRASIVVLCTSEDEVNKAISELPLSAVEGSQETVKLNSWTRSAIYYKVRAKYSTILDAPQQREFVVSWQNGQWQMPKEVHVELIL